MTSTARLNILKVTYLICLVFLLLGVFAVRTNVALASPQSTGISSAQPLLGVAADEEPPAKTDSKIFWAIVAFVIWLAITIVLFIIDADLGFLWVRFTLGFVFQIVLALLSGGSVSLGDKGGRTGKGGGRTGRTG